MHCRNLSACQALYANIVFADARALSHELQGRLHIGPPAERLNAQNLICREIPYAGGVKTTGASGKQKHRQQKCKA